MHLIIQRVLSLMRPSGQFHRKGGIFLSRKRTSSALHSLKNIEMKNYPAIKERKIKDLDNGTKACGLPERPDSL